jgi:hypothetical protein
VSRFFGAVQRGRGAQSCIALLLAALLAAIVTFLVAGLFEYNFGDTEVLLIAVAWMALPFTVSCPPASPTARA